MKVASLDFFSEAALPRHDVIVMGMILHGVGLVKKLQLMKKAYEALPEGGMFVAIENIIDDERRHNTRRKMSHVAADDAGGGKGGGQ